MNIYVYTVKHPIIVLAKYKISRRVYRNVTLHYYILTD